uniref:Uncharacterized protein n=1 Tax=Candidatus Kentrum sp. MB TaxID=2138164 RepID=A0A450Y2D7_9GAMM|nr:MAG: hypothetical protein BECKMB1821I_GA0114274_11373 [Candidatus Kentron sp. MB]
MKNGELFNYLETLFVYKCCRSLIGLHNHMNKILLLPNLYKIPDVFQLFLLVQKTTFHLHDQ